MSHGGHKGHRGGGGMGMLMFLILAWIVMAPFAVAADIVKVTRRRQRYSGPLIDPAEWQKDCEWMGRNPLPKWALDRMERGERMIDIWFRGVPGCPE